MAGRPSNDPPVEAILGSTALPGVFPLEHIGGGSDGRRDREQYTVRLAADFGASQIIILPTGYEGAADEGDR